MDISNIMVKLRRSLPASLLLIAGIIYCYLAAMPKHGDFWSILRWSTIFSQDPLHYMDIILKDRMIQIYPPSFNIIQGTWLKIGSLIFNYDFEAITAWQHPSIFPLWGMIPTLIVLFLFAVAAYYYLDNKWLSLICFGTISFVSVIIMGQVDIWYAFFIFLSLIFLLKSYESEKYLLYLSVSLFFLGISLTFKMFGGLLLPLYLLFIAGLLVRNKIKPLNTVLLLVVFIAIFAIAALAVWIPYARWFIPVYAQGESNWLFNLQIAPIDLPPYHTISIWLIGYVVILYCALKDVYKHLNNSTLSQKCTIFYIFAAVSWLFISVYNHPQWWVFMLPPMLLSLDHFKNTLNYLFALVLLTLFLFFPMLWVNNVDLALQYYIPTIPITDRLAVILPTLMASILVIWIMNLRYELADLANGKADEKQDELRVKFNGSLDRIAPLAIVIIPFLAAAVVGYTFMIANGHSEIGGVNPDKPVGEIFGNNSAGQIFVAKNNGLYAVEVNMATYLHQNLKDATFHLRTSPTSEDIRTVILTSSNVKNNAYVAFTFEPIPDSGGREYYFSIESTSASQDTSITVWYSSVDTYQGGMAYYNSMPLSGDLSFKTTYKFGLVNIVSVIRSGEY